MRSPDHPELEYLEALKTNGAKMYTVGRPDGAPLWIVLHDMEFNEIPSAAEWTANYFHTGAGGRSVSSHYTADVDSIVQCVLLKHSAWTVGNREGNNRGINWEFAGFARQTREEWLDAFGRGMFSEAFPIMRADARKYGIPLVHRTIGELQAFLPGVTSHNDLGRAFGGTDHTDPGSNFPWDWFMAGLNMKEEAMREYLRVRSTGSVYEHVGTDPETGKGALIHVRDEQYFAFASQRWGANITEVDEEPTEHWVFLTGADNVVVENHVHNVSFDAAFQGNTSGPVIPTGA